MDRYPNNSPKRSKILIGKWIGTALLAAVLVYFFLNPALYHKVITAADPSQGTTSAMDYGQIIATLLLTALGIAALWAPCPFSFASSRWSTRTSTCIVCPGRQFIRSA